MQLAIAFLLLSLCSAASTLAQSTAKAPIAAQSAIDRIEHRLMPAILIDGEVTPVFSLEDRMAFLKVPAVSIAVIDNGQIAWTRAYGMADAADGRRATTNTLFQAASISKPVAATAALTLVEEGRLDLDTDVNRYLRRWQVPASEHAHGQVVTLRRIMTHTAGLTVSGFPGYARSDEILTTVGVLDGLGNTAAVRVDTTPGAIYRYSGGGYTVMQVMLADVTGRPFAQLMEERVLDPMGMTLSTYEQPLPQRRWDEAASGYRSDGSPVGERWNVYPEQAAAGLWTTPSELARWGLAILASYDGARDGVLSPDMARQMLDPDEDGRGLGPEVDQNRLWFGHGGGNQGFRCQLVVFLDGRGAVVMTNADNGRILIGDILATLADEYDWSAYRATRHAVVELDRAVYDALVGDYVVQVGNSAITVKIARDGNGRLRLLAMGLPSFELLPTSKEDWFARENEMPLAVEWHDGRVVAFRTLGFRAERAR